MIEDAETLSKRTHPSINCKKQSTLAREISVVRPAAVVLPLRLPESGPLHPTATGPIFPEDVQLESGLALLSISTTKRHLRQQNREREGITRENVRPFHKLTISHPNTSIFILYPFTTTLHSVP